MKKFYFICFIAIFFIACSEQSLCVNVHNETNEDLVSYVVFTKKSSKSNQVSFKKSDINSLSIPKGEYREINLKMNSLCNLIFLDRKGYQYIKKSIRIGEGTTINVSKSDFEPRNVLELITKSVGLQTKSKEVTYVKD